MSEKKVCKHRVCKHKTWISDGLCTYCQDCKRFIQKLGELCLKCGAAVTWKDEQE